MNDAAAVEALRACDALTRRHSSTFHLGSRFFAPEKRKAVIAVYAACRSGDDAVDEAADAGDARRRLDAWWEAIERAYDDRPRSDAPLGDVEVGLAWVLERFDVPKRAFEALRLGFEDDLRPVRVQDLDELLTYCYRVAGVVGLMIAPVAGYDGGDETLASAVALGEAMQLTNVLRDVGEDLRRGRCYLPADMMERHGVTHRDLAEGAIDERYATLFEELASIADARYRHGWRGIPRLHGLAATAVGVAALNYEAILRKVRQNRYDNISRRAYLRLHERLVLIPKAARIVRSGT
jgi:phytoene synthase